MSSAHGSTTKRASPPPQSEANVESTWATGTTWGTTLGATSGGAVGTGGITGAAAGGVTFTAVALSRSRRSRSGTQDVRRPKVAREITRATRFRETNHILMAEGLSKKTLDM